MKLLSAGLAVCILLTFTLTGCGLIIINEQGEAEPKETEITEVTTELPETTVAVTIHMPESDKPVKPIEPEDKRALAAQYLNELPEYDFGNLAVLITSPEITSLVPQSTENFMYNTRIERNQAVEEKYSTKVIGGEEEFRTVYDKTYSAVYSGDFYTDILGVPMGALGQFYKDGLLMNLNMLPFIDYTKPYYDSGAITQMSVGNATYGLIGDFNKNMDYYYVMYFNKNLIKQFGLDNPYDLVYDNEWTMDKFRQMTRTVSNTEGIYGHGASMTIESYVDMFFGSTGEKYMDVGLGKIPAPRYNTTRTENLAAVLRNLLYNDNTVFDGDGGNGAYTEEGARTAFYDGKILFYIDRVNAMGWFVDMNDDWGLVPIPKLDKSQRYNTFVNEALPVICVPANITNINNTGLAIQALNAASYGFINENYYSVLQRDVVRDTDSLNMLDYINGKEKKGQISVDFALMFGSVYTYIADGTYKAVQTAVKNNYTISSIFDRHVNNIRNHNRNVFTLN